MTENQNEARHNFLTVLPDLSAVENDLMKLLNDFNNTKLSKYSSDKNVHEEIFKKMDAVRDKQEKIAKTHFEQDIRLAELNAEREDHKTQSMKDLDELTKQLDELSNSM